MHNRSPSQSEYSNEDYSEEIRRPKKQSFNGFQAKKDKSGMSVISTYL